jgi:2-oxoglutarate/2-oxoacid ferredoxin oxidoreductase subunit alpha
MTTVAAPRSELLQGSDAIVRASIVAGCRFFAGYPMAPFTQVLEEFSHQLPQAGGVCMNAESEIEAVNMALGASATGARSATGSTGQGIALMQEAIAEAAFNELPLVVINIARGQQDYFQATRGGGWGDYRTLTLAPKNVAEAVEHTQLLFDVADRYRVPVLLYGDYIVAHTQVSVAVEPISFPPLAPKDWALDGSTGGTQNSREIFAYAMGKTNAPGVGPDRHWNAIADKFRDMESAQARWEAAHLDDAETLIVSFGTSAVFVDHVVEQLRADDGVKLGTFRPITLWPFPYDALEQAARGVRRVLSFELNAGQMIDDVLIAVQNRAKVRSIGGLSQDQHGLRQGPLLDANIVRDRIRAALEAGNA